jgi:soluble lytic murein transglycosylase-like protein
MRDVSHYFPKGVSNTLRPESRSRVVAALMVMLVWLAALVSGPRPAQGASIAVAAFAGPTERQLLDQQVMYQRQQELRAASQRLQEQEEQRQEQEALSEYSQLLHREAALRNLKTRQIGDLVPEEYRTMVMEVAERYEIDPRLLAAMGFVESRWHATSVGSHGDRGLMQILPSTAEWIAGKMGLKQYDLFDPMTNVTMGAWYLHVLQKEYGGWPQALAVYNGGPRAAEDGPNHRYYKRVMSVYEQGP